MIIRGEKMKFLGRLIVIFFLLFGGICISNNFVENYSQNSLEAKTVYLRTALTGGGLALDGIDGSLLGDADVAFVMYSSVTYFYLLDADLGGAESSPDIIAPDTNPGNKRWVLQGSTPIGGGGGAPSNAHYYTNQVESGLSAEVVPSANVITLLTATDYADFRSKAGLGTMAVETATNYVPKSLYDAYSILMATDDNTPVALTVGAQTLLGRKTGGAIAALSGADALLAMGITPLIAELNYVDGVTSPIQTQLDARAVGPASATSGYSVCFDGTTGKLLKECVGASILALLAAGAPDNSFFGKNYLGIYGYYTNSTTVWVAAPADDNTQSGTLTTGIAGPAAGLTRWDIVYSKNKAGVEAFYPYDSDGTDKAEPPRCVAISTVVENAAFSCLIEGIVRNDGWGMTTGQDEGKKVYASTTAGGITLTEPATDGVAIGTVREQNVVHFKFKNDGASTGYGAPVKANTPTLITPVIGAATGDSVKVTGISDGLVNVTVTTSTPITVGGAGKLQGYYLNQHATPATAITYNLPVASTGQHHYFKNSVGAGGANTGILTIHPVTDSYITHKGTTCTVSYNLVSTGAAEEFLDLIGVDATHWESINWNGTWTCAAP